MRTIFWIAIGGPLMSAATLTSIGSWPTATPESQHMSSAKLDSLR